MLLQVNCLNFWETWMDRSNSIESKHKIVANKLGGF